MVFLFLRCGWSVNESSLQLGEDIRSYGFGGTGKSSRNSQFSNYGSKYGVGDVIGCYLVNPLKTFIFWQRNNTFCPPSGSERRALPYLLHTEWTGFGRGLPSPILRARRQSPLSSHLDQKPELHGELWPDAGPAPDLVAQLHADWPGRSQ